MKIFTKSIFRDWRLLLGLWLLLAVLAGLTKSSPHRCNNYIIFQSTYWHTLAEENLYDYNPDGVETYHLSPALQISPLYKNYPTEYRDHNLYGPFFALLIMPFALHPHPVGLILWLVALTLSLFLAVRALPGRKGIQIFIYWFCAHELLTALFMQQFNIAIAAILVGAFALIEKEKEVWATLLIMIGTFVKIYGLAGMAFFFFSKHKKRFLLYSLMWSVVLFCAPMLISSPEYVVGQYREWALCIMDKNGMNSSSMMQNISLLGFVHRTTGLVFSDLLLIVPGLLLFAAPYLRRKQWEHLPYRYAYLASSLLFVVLFSSGSESSSYIIALTGVVVWYSSAPWKRGGWDLALIIFAFILTSLSPSDLFPKVVRENYVWPYALKALPCILVWFKLVIEMLTKDYVDPNDQREIVGGISHRPSL